MLRTEHVYIDTEQWRGIRLDWNNELAQALLAAALNDRVALKTTDVLRGELRAHIHRGVRNYVASLRKAEKGRSVALVGLVGAFDSKMDFDLLQSRLEVELEMAMYRYFVDCKAVHLRHRSEVVDVILQHYFDSEAPFEEREEKKHEFPDAIVLDTLEHWCGGSGSSMYVVSQDKGIRAYCENSDSLIHVENLAALIREMNEGSVEDRAMKKLLDAHQAQISDAIESTVLGLKVRFSDGSEDSAEITSAKAQIRRSDLVLRPSPTEYVAYVNASITMQIAAAGDDPHMWIKDQKTGDITYLQKHERKCIATLEGAFKVGISVEADAGNDLDVAYAEPIGDRLIVLAADWFGEASDDNIRAYFSAPSDFDFF